VVVMLVEMVLEMTPSQRSAVEAQFISKVALRFT